jgi:hypothetical protein
MKQGVGGCDVAPHIHVHIYTSYFSCSLASPCTFSVAAFHMQGIGFKVCYMTYSGKT